MTTRRKGDKTYGEDVEGLVGLDKRLSYALYLGNSSWAAIAIPVCKVLEISAHQDRLSHSWLSEGRRQGFLMRDNWVMNDPVLQKNIADANELNPIVMEDEEVAEVIAFLEALTDPASELDLSMVPDRVPSGLSIDR